MEQEPPENERDVLLQELEQYKHDNKKLEEENKKLKDALDKIYYEAGNRTRTKGW